MKKLITILFLFICASTIAQDITNNVGFTKRVRFKGLTIVKDTALLFQRSTDSCWITLIDDTLRLMPVGYPTNFSSTGAGSQWTTLGNHIYLTDTTSHVAMGNTDTTHFVNIDYGDSSSIEMRDTLNGVLMISKSTTVGVDNSVQVTKNGVYTNGMAFGISIAGISGSAYFDPSGVQFANFPYIRSDVNANDSDDVVVFGQVIKSMTIKLAATTGNAATYEIIYNNTGYDVDGITYNFDGDYLIELNSTYFEAADKYAAFGANGYDTGLGDFVNLSVHRQNDDNLHLIVHNGAGTFFGDFTDVYLKIEFYENN